MCIIYYKVESKVPVIIMGETGCGKKSLIQYLYEYLLDDNLEIVNIHAGTTSFDIVSFINKFEKTKLKNPKQKLWVFFDEFNTTPDIYLISEIMTKRTMFGKPLPERFLFLGACNPYIKKDKSQELIKGSK